MVANDNIPAPEDCPGCAVCGVSRGGESDHHHWMEDIDEKTGQPIWACKHCSATRLWTGEDDFEND